MSIARSVAEVLRVAFRSQGHKIRFRPQSRSGGVTREMSQPRASAAAAESGHGGRPPEDRIVAKSP
jgi:hypothetical protein